MADNHLRGFPKKLLYRKLTGATTGRLLYRFVRAVYARSRLYQEHHKDL